MNCIYCNSNKVHKDGNHNGLQRYKCLECKKRFDGEKYENSRIVHFNTSIKKKDTNTLTRDNYCIPTNKVSYKQKKNIEQVKKIIEQHGSTPLLAPWEYEYLNIPNEKYADGEHYTEEYVRKHYIDCMENFDLNMNFFASINHNEFNNYLSNFVKKNKFIEIKDLNIVSQVSGLYILVLDKYNQVYIGKSETGIKKRILNHWNRKKEFGHLLNGDVDKSILSIDSFGALDTTRIFYKELGSFSNLDEQEEKMVKLFKKDYRLNRVAGGINSEKNQGIRNIELMSSIQERSLKKQKNIKKI
ncbi:MAG: hypothetical protein ACI4WU_02335 [Bacilli bacterium]